MMSKYAPSGASEFDMSYCQDNIIINRMYGQWHVECAKKIAASLLQTAKDSFDDQPWGLLNDMSQWELCPPDVIEYFDNIVFEFTKLKLRFQAVIPNNQIQKMIVNQYVESTQNGLRTKYFEDEKEALTWLRSQVHQ